MEFIATVSNVLTIQVRKSGKVMKYRRGNLGKLWPTGEKSRIVVTYGREIWDSYVIQERNLG
jgi:hypothetical protein